MEGCEGANRPALLDGLGRGLGLRDDMLGPGEIDLCVLPMRLRTELRLLDGDAGWVRIDGLLRRMEMEKPPRWIDEGLRLIERRELEPNDPELEDRLRLESPRSDELRLGPLLPIDGEDRTCGVLGRLGARADLLADRREARLLRDDLAPSTEEAPSKAAPTTTATSAALQSCLSATTNIVQLLSPAALLFANPVWPSGLAAGMSHAQPQHATQITTLVPRKDSPS